VFVRDERPLGKVEHRRETIVMVHGVPASSYLYHKLFEPLVQKYGFRAVAMDLPGLGLSDKALDYEYSWPSLASALDEILNHSDLDLFQNDDQKLHLVIHDIGGPIAALWASENDNSQRVASITALDTLLNLETFRKPFPMNLFPLPMIGYIARQTMTPWVFRHFMYLRGVKDCNACTHDEAVAWVWLLNHNQGLRSFHKIMTSFPITKEEREHLTQKICVSLGKDSKKTPAVAMQIVWADGEVAIPSSQRQYIKDNFNVSERDVHLVSGRHFFQMESANEIADKIHSFLEASSS